MTAIEMQVIEVADESTRYVWCICGNFWQTHWQLRGDWLVADLNIMSCTHCGNEAIERDYDDGSGDDIDIDFGEWTACVEVNQTPLVGTTTERQEAPK